MPVPIPTQFQLLNQTLWLHPLRAIFWEEQKALLLADLHLGKARHFRRNGIPVPLQAGEKTLENLVSVLDFFQPEKVYLLRDLFHSDYNAAWEGFQNVMEQYATSAWILIEGNHDILPEEKYKEAGLAVVPQLKEGPFLFTHHPLEDAIEESYVLSGHIHPCIKLSGRGRQRLRLPCFYFGKRQGLLPSFGTFTGSYPVEPKHGDQIFVIAEEKIMAL
jgi:DNA ligase-associated metallophosphoesterase